MISINFNENTSRALDTFEFLAMLMKRDVPHMNDITSGCVQFELKLMFKYLNQFQVLKELLENELKKCVIIINYRNESAKQKKKKYVAMNVKF